MTQFTLSVHAQNMIAERGIALEWIERVLSAPERVDTFATDPAVQHAIGRIPERANRVLRVIYDGSVQPVRIVTAYFDRTLGNRL